jgi:hypothetical protein
LATQDVESGRLVVPVLRARGLEGVQLNGVVPDGVRFVRARWSSGAAHAPVIANAYVIAIAGPPVITFTRHLRSGRVTHGRVDLRRWYETVVRQLIGAPGR